MIGFEWDFALTRVLPVTSWEEEEADQRGGSTIAGWKTDREKNGQRGKKLSKAGVWDEWNNPRWSVIWKVSYRFFTRLIRILSFSEGFWNQFFPKQGFGTLQEHKKSVLVLWFCYDRIEVTTLYVRNSQWAKFFSQFHWCSLTWLGILSTVALLLCLCEHPCLCAFLCFQPESQHKHFRKNNKEYEKLWL